MYFIEMDMEMKKFVFFLDGKFRMGIRSFVGILEIEGVKLGILSAFCLREIKEKVDMIW